jgi:hypothetical protein
MRSPFRRPSVPPARETNVTFHEHRGSRRRLDPIRKESAEELAAIRKLGLTWRETWRAEKAGPIETANGQAAAASTPSQRDSKSTGGSSFAEGIARAEFGRFYWNAKLERALRAARGPGTKHNGRKRE